MNLPDTGAVYRKLYIADSLNQKSFFPQASGLYRDIISKLFSGKFITSADSTQYFRALNGVFYCTVKTGEWSDLILFYNKLIATFKSGRKKWEAVPKSKHYAAGWPPDLNDVYMAKSDAYWRLGNRDSAAYTAQAALSELGQLGDYRWKQKFHFQLSQIYREVDTCSDKASYNLQKSVYYSENIPGFDTSQLIVQYGLMVGWLNSYTDSCHHYYEKAEKVRHKMNEVSLNDQFPFYNCVGSFLSDINLLDKAFLNFFAAFRTARELNSPELTARAALSLGELLVKVGKHEDALKYAQIAHRNNADLCDNPSAANKNDDFLKFQYYYSMCLMRTCYKLADKPDSALFYAKKAYNFCKINFPQRKHLLADAAVAIGGIYLNISNKKKANEYALKSLELYKASGVTGIHSNSYELLGIMLSYNGDTIKSKVLVDSLKRDWGNWAVEKQGARVKNREGYAANMQNVAKISHNLYMSTSDLKYLSLYDSCLRNALVEYDYLIENTDIANASGYLGDKIEIVNNLLDVTSHRKKNDIQLNFDEVADIFENQKSLLLKKQRFDYLSALNIPDGIRVELAFLRTQRVILIESGADEPAASPETQKNLLAVNSRIDFLQTLIEPSLNRNIFKGNVSVSSIMRHIDKKTAVLNYALTDYSIYILTLSASGSYFNVIKLDSTLKTEIAGYHKSLVSKDTSGRFRAASLHLFEILVKNAIPSLSGIQRLVIIPDGSLNGIPFETFSSSGTGKNTRYLIDDYNIRYEYSLSSLVKPAPTGISNKGILAIAPDYSKFGDSNKTDDNNIYSKSLAAILPITRDTWAPLNNEEEVNAISSGQDCKKLTAGGATEDAVNAEARHFNILHFATHAIVIPGNPNLSGIILASTSPGNLAANSDFTGFKDSLLPHDNILHAYEIQHMNLNAEIVVLSACETGVGKYETGEGAMSLARAFSYANCPNVVMSSWVVYDRSTVELMTIFYKNLENGMGKMDALADAKRKFRKKHKNTTPYFWASFVLVGDNLPVHFASTRYYLTWYLALIFVILFAFIISVRRYRRRNNLLPSGDRQGVQECK